MVTGRPSDDYAIRHAIRPVIERSQRELADDEANCRKRPDLGQDRFDRCVCLITGLCISGKSRLPEATEGYESRVLRGAGV